MERLDVLHPSIDEYLLEVIPVARRGVNGNGGIRTGKSFSDCRSARWSRVTPIGATDEPNADLRDGIRFRLFGILDGKGIAATRSEHYLHRWLAGEC